MHRGVFHSIPFGLLLATAVMWIGFRDLTPRKSGWWGRWALLAFIAASHGVLDAMTHGYGGPAGRGVALFSPFVTTRYWLPRRPYVISPGIAEFFQDGGLSPWGAAILRSEGLYLYLPLAVILACGILIRRRRNRKAQG